VRLRSQFATSNDGQGHGERKTLSFVFTELRNFSIDVFSMTNFDNQNHQPLFLDFVDNAVIAGVDFMNSIKGKQDKNVVQPLDCS
jgi:hypothetical protein